MKRCVIVAAGEIRDYERLRVFLREKDAASGDFFIFCDGGLSHVAGLCLFPDLIVGDFDSCNSDELMRWKGQCEMVRLPREKDDTDTFFAVKLALERGYSDFVFLGAMGGRFDHALGNVSVLLYLYRLGKKAVIIDDYSLMQVTGRKPFYITDSCSYFSVLTVAGDVKGVNIKNARYPLENASLTADFQLGISNEVLPGKVAEVSVEEGQLLVVVVK